jgi:hypothetical protein
LCRFAQAKLKLGHADVALKLIKEAERRDPNNKDIRAEKQKVCITHMFVNYFLNYNCFCFHLHMHFSFKDT